MIRWRQAWRSVGPVAAAGAIGALALAAGGVLESRSLAALALVTAASVGAAAVAAGIARATGAAADARAADVPRESRKGALLEQVPARGAAESAQHDTDEIFAAIRHELRTPLNAIQGFVHVLLSEIDGPLTPAQREDVEAMRQAGFYLKELVDEVLDPSRLTPTSTRLERVDVGEIVRDVARLLEAQRGRKPIDVEIDVSPDLPRMHADPRCLRQILLNLGTNAIKFTRAGRVRLVARATHDAVRIAVEDTGAGIAAQDLARMFRPFERSQNVPEVAEGWGLGLAIAREMAERHAGRIEVRSGVGLGSTFTLVLPLRAVR